MLLYFRISICSIFIVFFFLSHQSPAQRKTIDSLQLLLLNRPDHTQQITILNQLAMLYRRISPEKGLQYAKKAQNIATHQAKASQIAASNQTLAVLYTKLKKYPQAQTHLNKARLFYEEAQSFKDLAKVYLLKGNMMDDQNESKQATTAYKKAFEFLKKVSTSKEQDLVKLKVKIHNNLGNVYSNTGNFAEAQKHYLEALELSTQKKHQVSIYINLIQINRNLADYGQALLYSKKALELAKEISDASNIADIYRLQGQVYEFQSVHEEALKLYNQALEIHSKLGDTTKLLYSLTGIASVYTKLEKYEQGLKLYNKALSMAVKVSHKAFEMNIKSNIAVLYFADKDYQKSLEVYNEALMYFEKKGMLHQQGTSLHGVGSIYFEQQQYQKALSHYLKAYSIFKQINDKYYKAYVANDVSKVMTRLKRYPKSREYASEAVKIAEQLNAKDILLESYRHQYVLDSLQGDFFGALKNHQKHSRIRQELNDIKKAKQTAFLRVNYGLKEKEELLKAKGKENKLLQEQNRYKQIQVLFLAVGMGVLCLGAVWLRWLIKNNHKKNEQLLKFKNTEKQLLQQQLKYKEIEGQILHQQLETDQHEQLVIREKLETKDHELTKQSLYLIQYTQLLEVALKEIQEMIKLNDSPAKTRLKDLAKRIKKEFSRRSPWENFTQTFEMAHPNFYKRLRQRFPDLTEYDLKLCALLRLGFESRELASILNITLDSAKKARFRLRKKMKISEQDLSGFMRDI
ncbi:tetratricopeptide repeat protein [Microscilla marina]|uniref:Putative ggdef family protein n=1 Tax=Microscilla marina ATCC 23134 TaxID=313606 RepID=A1ZQL2_MICM2|nr:tetratricopeptide repeat protein [Microscilla marina]EAY27384.1 putative ggdef family protein [Microscilla marina ATCC 23134]